MRKKNYAVAAQSRTAANKSKGQHLPENSKKFKKKQHAP